MPDSQYGISHADKLAWNISFDRRTHVNAFLIKPLKTIILR